MHYFDTKKDAALVFPPLVSTKVEAVADTWPMPLHDLPENHQIEQALNVIGEKHPHIAKTIATLWGFQEGADYLARLIFDGSDLKSYAREGFRSEVLAALLTLQSIHSVAEKRIP